MPGAYRDRCYGRFSDLLRLQAPSHRSATVTFAWGIVEITAAGTVQEFHLLPSQGYLAYPFTIKSAAKLQKKNHHKKIIFQKGYLFKK